MCFQCMILVGETYGPNITNCDIPGYIMSIGFQNYEILPNVNFLLRIQILCKGR